MGSLKRRELLSDTQGCRRGVCHACPLHIVAAFMFATNRHLNGHTELQKDYIFETHQVAVNTLNSDCEVRFDEDTYTMMEQKKDIASTGMGANLMPGMYWCYNTGAQVLKTLPWCYTWRIASAGPTMIVLEGEFSVKCMKLLDDACLLQIAYRKNLWFLPKAILAYNGV